MQKNLSALAYNIDFQYENHYIKYNFESVQEDTYTTCKYCKGKGYIECILCETGCIRCCQSGYIPCHMCNLDYNIKKSFPLFIEGSTI